MFGIFGLVSGMLMFGVLQPFIGSFMSGFKMDEKATNMGRNLNSIVTNKVSGGGFLDKYGHFIIGLIIVFIVIKLILALFNRSRRGQGGYGMRRMGMGRYGMGGYGMGMGGYGMGMMANNMLGTTNRGSLGYTRHSSY